MKKTLLTLIVCCICGLTYADSPTPIFTFDIFDEIQYIPKSYPNLEYIMVNKSTDKQVTLEYYKAEDFTLTKQITFPIQEAAYNIVAVKVLSTNHVFVRLKDTQTGDESDSREKLVLYDSDGRELVDFGISYRIQLVETIVEQCTFNVAPNKLIFLVIRDTENSRYYELYYLTTSVENGTQSVQVEKKAAFPCPARGEVNIPTRGQHGDLRVLNLNGQVLDAQRIQEGDYQRVNTESYPTGTYIYQAGNETGKFMVE